MVMMTTTTTMLTRHTSHVTRHASRVTRHTSHVTRHASHVTRHPPPPPTAPLQPHDCRGQSDRECTHLCHVSHVCIHHVCYVSHMRNHMGRMSHAYTHHICHMSHKCHTPLTITNNPHIVTILPSPLGSSKSTDVPPLLPLQQHVSFHATTNPNPNPKPQTPNPNPQTLTCKQHHSTVFQTPHSPPRGGSGGGV